jgi:hypothetical protein
MYILICYALSEEERVEAREREREREREIYREKERNSKLISI